MSPQSPSPQRNERLRLPPRRRHRVVEYDHGGIRCIAGFGFFEDGALAELFINAGKPGSAVETAARDAAIILSLALQHGCPLETIRHALTKLADGRTPAGPVGAAIDELLRE